MRICVSFRESMSLLTINKGSTGRRFIASLIVFAFLGNTVIPAQAQSAFSLPTPGVRVGLSPQFQPTLLKAVKVYTDNPFKFDFIVDTGDSNLEGQVLKDESNRLIKYFL